MTSATTDIFDKTMEALLCARVNRLPLIGRHLSRALAKMERLCDARVRRARRRMKGAR